jgi:hypothetical protein
VKSFLGWAWFVVVQLVMFVALVLGFFILIYPCCTRAWIQSEKPSIKDGQRAIDRWRWRPLNWIYGNPEDGVSGQTALIMINPVMTGSYLPKADDRWRAYRWSAWRNSCDNLKYVFAWQNGPYSERLRMGWKEENGMKVPVF